MDDSRWISDKWNTKWNLASLKPQPHNLFIFEWGEGGFICTCHPWVKSSNLSIKRWQTNDNILIYKVTDKSTRLSLETHHPSECRCRHSQQCQNLSTPPPPTWARWVVFYNFDSIEYNILFSKRKSWCQVKRLCLIVFF